jgi:hypothetical protein
MRRVIAVSAVKLLLAIFNCCKCKFLFISRRFSQITSQISQKLIIIDLRESAIFICVNQREKNRIIVIQPNDQKVVNPNIKYSTFLQKALTLLSKFIDFPSAIAGGLIMGIIVGIINRKFGAWPATTAAMKQAAYTFLFGGMLTKLLYIIAGKIPGKITSTIISALIVSIITVMLVYAVHSMKGTPMPLESTIPTAILAPFGFSFLAYRRKMRTT